MVGDLRKFIEGMDDRIPVKLVRHSGDRRGAQRSEDVVMLAEQEGAVVILDRSALSRMMGYEPQKTQGAYSVEDNEGGFGVLNLEHVVDMVRQLRGGESLKVARAEETQETEAE